MRTPAGSYLQGTPFGAPNTHSGEGPTGTDGSMIEAIWRRHGNALWQMNPFGAHAPGIPMTRDAVP
jgi:hypothetical protein